MAGVKAHLERQGYEVEAESEVAVTAGLIREVIAVDLGPKSLAVVDRQREGIVAVQAQGKKIKNKIGVAPKIARAKSKDMLSPGSFDRSAVSLSNLKIYFNLLLTFFIFKYGKCFANDYMRVYLTVLSAVDCIMMCRVIHQTTFQPQVDGARSLASSLVKGFYCR